MHFMVLKSSRSLLLMIFPLKTSTAVPLSKEFMSISLIIISFIANTTKIIQMTVIVYLSTDFISSFCFESITNPPL